MKAENVVRTNFDKKSQKVDLTFTLQLDLQHHNTQNIIMEKLQTTVGEKDTFNAKYLHI